MARSKNVDSWIAELDPLHREISVKLRDLILHTEPSLKETIKWGHPIYEKDGNVCYLACNDRYVTLGFFNGAALNDPQKLIEGTGVKMRHVKLWTMADIQDALITTWVKQATALNQQARRHNFSPEHTTNGTAGSSNC